MRMVSRSKKVCGRMTCPRKSGGEAQVEIETALKYKKSQGLELAISRQPWWKNNKISVKIQVEMGI